MYLSLLVVVVVAVPNGLVYDLWVKHTFSEDIYKFVGKHCMFDKYIFQKWHEITTNIKHHDWQTFGDNNENTLLTKSSAESDSIFQMMGSYTKQTKKKTIEWKITRKSKRKK